MVPLIVLAFWGVICYLPPFRGTRNNHWNYWWKFTPKKKHWSRVQPGILRNCWTANFLGWIRSVRKICIHFSQKVANFKVSLTKKIVHLENIGIRTIFLGNCDRLVLGLKLMGINSNGCFPGKKFLHPSIHPNPFLKKKYNLPHHRMLRFRGFQATYIGIYRPRRFCL